MPGGTDGERRIDLRALSCYTERKPDSPDNYAGFHDETSGQGTFITAR
jgi:hypothetical protein